MSYLFFLTIEHIFAELCLFSHSNMSPWFSQLTAAVLNKRQRHNETLETLCTRLKVSPCTTRTKQFALVTRRPYCPGGPKKLCFTTLSLIPMVSIARLSVLKQSSFGLPGQYGRRVTRVNANKILRLKGTTYTSCLESFCAAVLDIYETATMCSP